MSSSSKHSGDDGFKLVKTKKNMKRKSSQHNSESSSDEQYSLMKKAAITQLQPVVLATTDENKPLASISSIEIDKLVFKKCDWPV